MATSIVSLTVESLGNCMAPAAVLHPGSPQKPLPFTLKPKQKLTVAFDLIFECANDSLASTAQEDHSDYRYTVHLNHAALDGKADTHPEDDICPRSITLPFEIDLNPDGTIRDGGRGEKKADRTFGADILTDVIIK